jgi:hypothetical protein
VDVPDANVGWGGRFRSPEPGYGLEPTDPVFPGDNPDWRSAGTAGSGTEFPRGLRRDEA